MALYGYRMPDELPAFIAQAYSRDREASAEAFGRNLSRKLYELYGLSTQPIVSEDEIEIYKGYEGMCNDWFCFRFRFLSDFAIFVDMLNVPPNFRSHGIGHYVIEEFTAFAAALSVRYVFLDSLEPANQFWNSCGFRMLSETDELAQQYERLKSSSEDAYGVLETDYK